MSNVIEGVIIFVAFCNMIALYIISGVLIQL